MKKNRKILLRWCILLALLLAFFCAMVFLLPEKEEKFDPKSKIRDYIAATGDNGFNLDEVLNPGELQLEDLCKELGLIDGNE